MWLAILFVSIVGTLLHFTYEFSRNNKVMGIFAAVNESSWEHIKMGITATYLYSLVDGFLYGANPNYFLAKSVCVLLLIAVIPVIFYSYTAFTKKCILAIDIATFFIAIIVSQFAFYRILELAPMGKVGVYLSFLLFIALFGFYLTSTFLPMRNFLFLDPVSRNYGFVDVKHFKLFFGVDSEVQAINPAVIAADAKPILDGLVENGFQSTHTLHAIFDGEGTDYMTVNVNSCRVDVIESKLLEGAEGASAVKIYSKDLDKTCDRFLAKGYEAVVPKGIVKSTKLCLLKDGQGRYVYITEHVKDTAK